MNPIRSLRIAAFVGFALLASASQAGPLSSVASSSPLHGVAVEALQTVRSLAAMRPLQTTGSGITDSTVTPPPHTVPEPQTLALLGVGVAVCALSRRRRRKSILPSA